MKNLLFVTVGTSGLALVKREQRTADEYVTELVKAHKAFWEQNQMYTSTPENFRKSSAELTSTVALTKALQEKEPIAFDCVILLASATEDGGLAAKVVQKVMMSADYPATIPKTSVSVQEIPGLDQRWINMPVAILEAVAKHRERENDRCFFNITGGFKGTAATIGMLAYKHGFLLYYQHESLRSPNFIGYNLQAASEPLVWNLS